jgi:hypothetical protein
MCELAHTQIGFLWNAGGRHPVLSNSVGQSRWPEGPKIGATSARSGTTAEGRLRRFGRGPVNLGSWHLRDVTPAATRAAAIKDGAEIPARSPFMLRPRCRTQSNFVVVTPATGAVRPGPAVTASSRRVRPTVLRARRAATGSKIPIFGGGPFRSSSFVGRVRFRLGVLEYRANVISAASGPSPCMEGKRQLLESLFGRRARCRDPAFASASSIQTGA